ncbi:MAG TPA: FHA domain-containing protein [Sandaracinaceae bacterium LLY-WYZ-13_1]|nr:FHA domain-containing protein [Sandaracinaceae bacterium LLY-WYZ-13_1]
MDAWLEIIREDGTLERQRLEGERVTVGRSPSAGVPLPDARDLEPEHLMIAPRGDGCWVAVAQGAQVPAYVGGEPFQHGMLAWGTEIRIAGLRLKVTDQLPKEKKTEGEAPVSKPVLIAFFLIVPIVGWLLLSEPSTGIDMEPAAPPPTLFEETFSCPTSGGTARHRADQDAEAAIAKSERYPFSAQDGVQAVRLYGRAAACYRAVGASEPAGLMEREGDLMKRRIEEDYRTHRLRLERALEQGRLPDALLETRALVELLRHREADPYLAWLRQLARQLQLAIDAAST